MPTHPMLALHERLDRTPVWERSVHLRRGEPLVLAGTLDRNLYRVDRGVLASCREVSGEQQYMRFGYAGDYIMSVDCHITGRPSAYSLVALRKTEVAVARPADYAAWLREDHTNAAVWQSAKDWLIMGLLEREVDLLTASPEERYRRVLERSPRLFQEVPAKYIANYLRMTPETLSRLKKEG